MHWYDQEILFANLNIFDDRSP